MCGLIFHKDPSTGLHTLMALVSPLKIQSKYHMPWYGFMNGIVSGEVLRKGKVYHLVNLEGSEHQPLTINF